LLIEGEERASRAREQVERFMNRERVYLVRINSQKTELKIPVHRGIKEKQILVVLNGISSLDADSKSFRSRWNTEKVRDSFWSG
jgi:hypothetical protein